MAIGNSTQRVGLVALATITAVMGLSATVVTSVSPRQTDSSHGPLELTSSLGRKLYALPDDASVTAARAKLAADPNNPALAIALSQAQAGRRQYREAIDTCTKALAAAPDNADLLIERGHRELGMRNFTAAQTDLERATTLNAKNIQGFYHLGLADYFQGQFDAAADAFRKALALAPDSDNVIDCTNWLYVSLRRANRQEDAAQVLGKITPEIKNTGPHYAFYLRLLHFYQGSMSEVDVLPAKPKDANDLEGELAFDTVTYGVGNWHLYAHDPDRPAELFKQVVAGEAWNAWGFIGSEAELARIKSAENASR
jgi:tetratricopeptide (TPR) repeat protein